MSKLNKACAPMQLILQGRGQINNQPTDRQTRTFLTLLWLTGSGKVSPRRCHLSCASAEQMMIVPSGGQGSGWREACRGHRRPACCHGEGAVPGAPRLLLEI